jgi:hypothetical protein
MTTTLTRPRRGRRGLPLAALVVALPFTLTVPATVKGSDALDPAALPREVRGALDWAARTYPQPLDGARWSAAYRLEGSNHPVYQVQGTNARGNKIEAEVTSAGRVVEVEEHGVPLDEVPAVVTAALKAGRPGFAPTRVEAVYQAQQSRPVCYGFEGQGADGKKIEVYLSADGKTFLNGNGPSGP